MPKCLECGFESSRLQWTHFRYNCTGRFKNGTEYKKVYPNAKLVDDELAKRTAITKKNLIHKYGQQEGTQRWIDYCKKQAESNSYEYKKKKYGWNKQKFNEYNQSRAITIKNLISKYGEEEGTQRWIDYCQRQAYTNGLKYFQEKYGEEEGILKWQNLNQRKSHSIENIQIRENVSRSEAIKIWEEKYKNNNHVSNLEKQFVDEIRNMLGCELDYSYRTKQYCVYGNNKANFYDIVHNNRAIEFNGDYWHCNPTLYESNYYHTRIQEVASVIWKKDLEKIQLLEKERGIKTFVVWENDFIKNKEKTIKECIKWIQAEKK